MYLCCTALQFRLSTNVVTKTISSQYFVTIHTKLLYARILCWQNYKDTTFERFTTCFQTMPNLFIFFAILYCFSSFAFSLFSKKKYFDILIRFRLTQPYEKVAKDFARKKGRCCMKIKYNHSNIGRDQFCPIFCIIFFISIKFLLWYRQNVTQICHDYLNTNLIS